MEFPVYPILKRDKKTDILYVGATLKHANRGKIFSKKKMGKDQFMIIEEKKYWRYARTWWHGDFESNEHE